MITVMRKHHKILMIFITALVCISFSWYWNRTDFAQMGAGSVGKIYDRSVSQVEFQRNMRLLRLASQLGMRDLVQQLTAGAHSENEAYEAFAWNLLVLRHEAQTLGLTATTNEIAAGVKGLPAFQTEAGFDLARYTDFADHALAPMGFGESQIEELVADDITLTKLQKILRAGISIPESELRSGYENAYAKMDVSVVRFHPTDFAKEVESSDDEIAKYYESHKAELQMDEKRKIKFVQFGLTDEQKKLTGKQRIDVLQKLADKANEFTDALQAKDADFDQVAAKFQLAPKETGDFSQAEPDPQLAGTPQLAQTGFALTKDSPNSDAIQTPDGFILEHLVKVETSRPLTLEEARPKIVEALKKQRVDQAIAAKATEVAHTLKDDLKNGKSLAEAATEAGVKTEKLPSFALVDDPIDATPAPKPEKKNETPDMQYIKQAASGLNPGGVSDYVNTPDGGLIVILEKRETIGPAQFEKVRPTLEERTLTSLGQIVFYEWLRERRRAAGIPEKESGTQPG